MTTILRRWTASILMVAVVGWLAAARVHAADKIPAERLLPSNVYAFLSVPNAADFKERFDDSMVGRLRRDRELAEFWKDVDAQIEKASDEVENHLGVSLKEILAIPSGEVAFAFVQEPGKKPGAVALLDFGDSEETIDKLLQKAEDALLSDDVGAERRVHEFEDTRIIVYSFEDEADDTANGARREQPFRQLTYFVRDSYLVIGSDTAVLESVLTRWDGAHDRTFAGNRVFESIKERTRYEDHQPMMVFYVNPIDMVKSALSAAGQGAGLQPQFFLGLVPGLNKFKAIGGSFDGSVGPYESISKVMIYVDLPAEGVLNLFQFPPTDQAPPNWVPSDAAQYMALNWDLDSAYKTVASLYDTFTFNPGGFDKLVDEAADDPNGPGVHPKKDVIDQLTGQIHVMTGAPENIENAEDLQDLNPRILVALGVRDAAKARDLLKKLAESPGFPGEKREFRGETVYDLPGGIGAGMAVARDGLVISSDVTLVEQLLRGAADKPLAEDADYQRMAKQVPDKTSIRSFERTDAQVQALYEMLRTDEAQDLLPPGIDIDLSKLPPFDKLRKYLPPTVSYAVPDKDGVMMVSFALRNENE